jgi:hypothetical protein
MRTLNRTMWTCAMAGAPALLSNVGDNENSARPSTQPAQPRFASTPLNR